MVVPRVGVRASGDAVIVVEQHEADRGGAHDEGNQVGQAETKADGVLDLSHTTHAFGGANVQVRAAAVGQDHL